MCICVSAQQNSVFWQKKSANSHFSAKKMVQSRTPSFVNGIGLKKSQPYAPVVLMLRPMVIAKIGFHLFTIHSLRVGWRNLPTLRVGWRSLFSSCAVVSVFGSGGKQILVIHITMYLEYHTVVLLCYFFWFWREIVFGVTYVLSVQYSCAVVSVFLLWRESFIMTGKKKVLVVCLAGARSLLRPEKKSSICDFYAKLNVSNLNVTNLYQFQLKLI